MSRVKQRGSGDFHPQYERARAGSQEDPSSCMSTAMAILVGLGDEEERERHGTLVSQKLVGNFASVSTVD